MTHSSASSAGPRRRSGRRTVLTGVAVAGLIGALLTPATPATAASAAIPVHGPDEFQIGIFWPPTSAHLDATQFDYLRDAHVNLIQNVSTTDLDTLAENNTMLALAGERGMKVSVSDSRSGNLDTAPLSQIDAIANDYKNNSATYGYYVKDEPISSEFAGFARAYRRLLLDHPESEPYVNLLNTGSGSSYPDYLSQWVDAVGASNLKRISFDNYPWLTDPLSIRPDYFEKLDQVRHAGLRYNVPTAYYLQSVGIPGVYRRPTANDMRYNAFTALAYGMKSVYWFTWWTPTNRSEQFTNAIIDANGNKTDLYAPLQNINSAIEKLGPTLVKLTSLSVYHSGVMAADTIPVPADFFWRPTNPTSNAIISHFRHENGREYVMVVNRTLTDNATLSFQLSPGVSNLTEVSATTGAEVPTDYTPATGVLSASFLPGQGRLFALPVGYTASTDLARHTGVSASSSVEGVGWSAAKLVDGTSSGWSSDSALTTDHTEWVSIDLGTAQVVNEIRLQPRSDGANAGQGYPVDFTVEISLDNATWTPVVARTGSPNPGSAAQTFTFGRRAARYVRIVGQHLRPNPADNGSYRMQFAEVELFHRASMSPVTGLLSDNFSGDLSRWVYADNTAIHDGRLHVTSDERLRNAAGGYDWTDYAFQASVRLTGNAIGLVFRASDDDNLYMWQLDGSGNLRPHRKVSGAWTLLKQVPLGTSPGTTHTILFEAIGSTIKTYVDGVLKDTTIDSTFTRGNVGFRADGPTEGADIDDVIVTAR